MANKFKRPVAERVKRSTYTDNDDFICLRLVASSSPAIEFWLKSRRMLLLTTLRLLIELQTKLTLVGRLGSLVYKERTLRLADHKVLHFSIMFCRLQDIKMQLLT